MKDKPKHIIINYCGNNPPAVFEHREKHGSSDPRSLKKI